MDWKDLADRLADGAKVYKVFQDGADAASQMAGLERSYAELLTQYDNLVTKLEQAKVGLRGVQDEVARTRTAASQDLSRQQVVWETTHAKRVETAQAELDGWNAKVAEQTQMAQTQAQWYENQIAQWEAALTKLQDQVKSLEQIKTSLKSQLQGVV